MSRTRTLVWTNFMRALGAAARASVLVLAKELLSLVGDAADGVLDLARGAVDLALVLEILVAGQVPGGLLDPSLGVIRRSVRHSVSFVGYGGRTHPAAKMLTETAAAPGLREAGANASYRFRAAGYAHANRERRRRLARGGARTTGPAGDGPRSLVRSASRPASACPRSSAHSCRSEGRR